jgi:pimeloyl-ACP methyl ester carboxylesterase
MTTDTFDSDGVEIVYDDVGEGPPVVLVHGFASSRHGTWKENGWYETLADAGRRVVAIDCRGHGESEKLHDPVAYGRNTMAEDVVRLLDHLSIPEADLMGYSMGGGISLRLLVNHPDRFNAVVPSGVGETVLGERERGDVIAEALEADDLDDVETQRGREFRIFAANRDNDLRALAAIQRSESAPIHPEQFADVSQPVLVARGVDDELVGDPGPLADAIPGAESYAVPESDHLSTTDDPRYEEAVMEFLAREGL